MPVTSSSLTWPDYAVLAIALDVLLTIGFVLSREQRDTVDFFLARRRVPWWAACLSFLATAISAVTILSAGPAEPPPRPRLCCPSRGRGW